MLQETARPNSAGATGPVRLETGPGATLTNPTATAPGSQTAFTLTRSEPEAPPDPWQGLPVPTFKMPPLWFKPPTEIAWQEARTVLPTGSGSSFNPAAASPETRNRTAAGPEYGVDRGFYYFTDRDGNIRVQALAGFVRRLAGAVVDSVVSFVIALITAFTVSFAFADMPITRQNMLNFYLVLIGLVYFFNFLYHAFLVGLTGQSLGHRALKIKVIRRGGRAVGLISGIVRALYGIVPYLINLVISLVLPTPATEVNPVVTILSIATVGLAALGMAWALFDKGHQGLHDKLADTYVVSVNES